VRGAKPGPSRPPLRTPSPHRCPLARMPRVRQRHDVAAVLAGARAKRGQSAGKPNAPPLNTVRPSALRPPPWWDNVRSPDRASPQSTRCHDGLQRQRQHHDAQGSPWPSRLRRQGPGASAGDESCLGSIAALPPANLHGYAEWDFSGVPDPVMFRRFLDATDYWFGYSDDSSTGSYDPARECCVVIANDPTNATGAAGAGDGDVTPAPGVAPRQAAGPSTPAGANIDVQPAEARELEAKLAEEYRMCGCSAPPWLGKPPRAASARGSWANKPATASTPISTSKTRTRLCGRARSLSPPQHYSGPCRPPQRPRRETCTASCRHSSSRRPSNRSRARRHASANRGTHEATGPRRGRTLGPCR
jgi:hypothetical protein